MGYRTSWVAVKGVSLEEVIHRIGWTDTGETIEMMDTGLYGIELAGGWALIVADGSHHMDRLTVDHARSLSYDRQTVYLRQSDTSMTAEIHGFEHGQETWLVDYDGSDGIAEPTTGGTAPVALAAVLNRCRADQEHAGGRTAGVDHMYEVVLELGLAVVGFRHDRIPEEGGPEPFHVLEAE